MPVICACYSARMNLLTEANQWLFLLINAEADAPRHAVTAAIFVAEYLVAVMLTALAAYLVWKHRRNKQAYIGVAASILVGIAITYLIRKGVYHPRPFMLHLGTNFLEHAQSSSFPSKHQTPLFSAGVFLCLLPATRLFGLLFMGASCAVAWSRIYLGVHWPLDMFGALTVGMMASVLVKFSFTSLSRVWVLRRYGQTPSYYRAALATAAAVVKHCAAAFVVAVRRRLPLAPLSLSNRPSESGKVARARGRGRQYPRGRYG